MVWTDEVGPVRLASGMPEKIVQRAQYMNDAMDSVFGKFTQSFNSEKSTTEFRGGIWDCNPIKETESSCRNNLSNKTFSLDEILACDEDTEMAETDDLVVSSQNKSSDSSDDASFSDMPIDVNIKRVRSEEFDKTFLLPCNDSETTRKKSKKTVSFSDTVIDLEDSFKSSGKTSKSLAFDVPAVEDVSSSLIENVIDEGMNNSVTLVSEKVNNIPTKMEDKRSAHEKKSVKENSKVKNWKKLMSQSSEIDFHDQQPCEQIPIDVALSKKLSREKHRSRKAKSDSAEPEIVTKKIVDNQKLELMNRSHLEKSIPELFQLIESKTEDETEPRSMKNVKEKNLNIRKLALEKETSQTLKKDPDIDVDLSKNEVKSKTSEELESTEERLKNSLFEMLGDSVMAESLTNHIKKLAEQKKKIVNVNEKDKIVSGNEQMDSVPKIRKDKSPEEKSVKDQTRHVGKVWSEDESQYKLESSAIQTEKNCCPPVCDKPSCNQSNFEKNGKGVTDLVNDIALKLNTNGTDNTSEKVSPTSYQEKISSSSISRSRSDSCSNWRSQCIDVLSKDEEKATPQNWRNDCSNLRNHKTRRVENWKNRQEKKLDLSSIEYVDDGMVVVPVYTKEPPSDPLSRFKDIKTDPESIWDACEEKSKPSRSCNQIQSQDNDFDQKNISKAEEVHAQLFRKIKNTSIPRFFDNPIRKFVPSKPDDEYMKRPSQRKIDSSSSGMFNENYRSRSQSRQGNIPHHRSFERNRSSSTHWRSSLSAASLEHDVFYIVKISSPIEDKVEKLRILKEDFLMEVRGNKLSDVIPSPGYKPKKIPYSASAVTMFVRCIFSLSFKISSWITALEAFVLAKKFGIEELKKYCEDYFTNFKIPTEPFQQVAAYAHQLHAVDAFKSSKFFHKIKDFRSLSTQYEYTPQSCTVSCSVLVDPSELEIPLLSEITRGLESCNVSDVRNRLFFKSLTHETCLAGIQLKFLTEDVHTQLKIECEVKGDSPEKLFYKYLETKAKSSIKISFDEITVERSKEIEIVVYIEDVLLKVCPQLIDDELVSSGQFHARFESSKTNGKKKLFYIEKLLYTTSQAW